MNEFTKGLLVGAFSGAFIAWGIIVIIHDVFGVFPQ